MINELTLTENTNSFNANYLLDGQAYNFKIYYNSTAERWYLDIRQQDEPESNEILKGIKIMPFQNLTKDYKSVNRSLFSGDIWSIPRNTVIKLEYPTLTTFGNNSEYYLAYLDKEDSELIQDEINNSI